MPSTEPQLSQTFRALGATAVTFLLVSGVSANPLAQNGMPVAVQREAPSLNLISPLDGLWDQLETVEPASDDLLTRLRYGFDLAREDNRRIRAELNWFVSHPDYLNRVFTRAHASIRVLFA
jgi:hypothetical protein